MDQQLSVPVWAALPGLALIIAVVVLAAVVLVRSRSRSAADLAAARADTAALASRVETLERHLARPAENPTQTVGSEPDYVVTMLGRADEDPSAPAPVVPAPLFADLVLREGVVQAASFAAGVRRALAPEVRHRIRFEMRREVKRARKKRRSQERQARRLLQDREAAA